MCAPLPVVSSPKFQEYDTIMPSGSLDPDASKWIGALYDGAVGVATNEAVGARFSTVTSNVALALAPSSSVTVSVTVYAPGAVYACVPVNPDVTASSPQAIELEAIIPSMSLAVPVAVNSSPVKADAGETLRVAVGARFRISTIFESVCLAPNASSTVSVTVYVRVPSVYRCVALGPALVASSPQAMLCVRAEPSGSDEDEPSAVMSSYVRAESGDTLSTATGLRFSTVTSRVVEALAPSSSVTRRRTVYVPGRLYW